MKKTFKTFGAFIIVCVAVIAVFSVTAFAVQPQKYEPAIGIEVYGYIVSEDGSNTIPEITIPEYTTYTTTENQPQTHTHTQTQTQPGINPTIQNNAEQTSNPNIAEPAASDADDTVPANNDSIYQIQPTGGGFFPTGSFENDGNDVNGYPTGYHPPENEQKNPPRTGDSLRTYIIIFAVSAAVAAVVLKKSKKGKSETDFK